MVYFILKYSFDFNNLRQNLKVMLYVKTKMTSNVIFELQIILIIELKRHLALDPNN